MAKKKAAPVEETPAGKPVAVSKDKKPAPSNAPVAVAKPAATPAPPTPLEAAQSAEKQAELTTEKAAESTSFKNLKAGLKKPAALGGQFAKPFNPNAKKGPAGFNNQNVRSQTGRSGTNTGVPRRTGGG